MDDYVKRSDVLGLLDAAQAEESAKAAEEELKAAGSMARTAQCEYAARALVTISDEVRALPAASEQLEPPEEEEETCS